MKPRPPLGLRLLIKRATLHKQAAHVQPPTIHTRARRPHQSCTEKQLHLQVGNETAVAE